jgi:hypothetical protein
MATGQEKTFIVESIGPRTAASISTTPAADSGHASHRRAASQTPVSGGDTGGGDTGARSADAERIGQVRDEAQWKRAERHLSVQLPLTITNNSDSAIEDWFITFTLPTDRITQVWSNAKLSHDTPEGTYRFAVQL